MTEPSSGTCSGVSTGVTQCIVEGGSTIEVTWSLSNQESLNGYDLEVRWNASALTLQSASQLFPDTGIAEPWLVEPSDPNASSAVAISLVASPTTSLFRLSFDVAINVPDGDSDVFWFPNGNGLSPGSVVLENSDGAGLDIRTAEVPALGWPGWGILGATLAWPAAARLRRRASTGRP